MGRVAAIGIDSAEWAELERLMDAGRMPNLARQRARSIHMPLQNQIVGQPEEAWTSFLHGDAPHAAGHWSSLTFDPDRYRSYRRGAFEGIPFYESAAPQALTFDVPKRTIRPGSSDVEVTGWGAHAPSFPRASKPAGLLTEIDRRFGPHPAYNNDFQNAWFQADYLDGLSTRLVDGLGTRADATRWLLDRYPTWDLFLTVLSEIHAGGHHLWHGVDPSHLLAGSPTAAQAGQLMTDVHQAIDAALGQILDSLPDDATTIVFAVHGMQPNDSDVASFLLLPELLHRLDGRPPRLTGPDHMTWANQGFPPVLPDPRRRPLAFARDHLDGGPRGLRARLATGPLLDVDRTLRRVAGRPPGNRRRWLTAADIPPEQDLSTFDPVCVEEQASDYPNLWYQSQWPTMRAFSLPSFGEGRVRINLVGRERHGIVPTDEYRSTCRSIEEALRETIDPRTGDSVVRDVLWVREHDPMDPTAPDADLVVTWRPKVDAFAHPTLGTIGPMPLMRTGEHSNNGFALVSGPGVEPAVVDPQPTAALPRAMIGLLGQEGAASPDGLVRAAGTS